MKKILDQIMILCCMAASLFCFGSCSDDLDIQQEYPFTVEAMPVACAGDSDRILRRGIKWPVICTSF